MFKNIISRIFGNSEAKQEQKTEVISFKQGFDLTELPIVTLYQGDKKLNFLLDTGSNNSIIDKNIVDQLNTYEINAKSNIFGMNGIKQTVNVCGLTLSYKDVKYDYYYLICDMAEAFGEIKKSSGVTLHGIIGSKFFNEFKYVLDFDELIAYNKR